jgi:branched-chain amino acid aminotransferase
MVGVPPRTQVGANYAITIMPQMLAAQHGCSQVLWMYRDAAGAHTLTEVGAMNLFILLKGRGGGKPRLITAPLTRSVNSRWRAISTR